jgi:hypothetical protein
MRTLPIATLLALSTMTVTVTAADRRARIRA